MELKEALRKLRAAGFICEDTDTHEDEESPLNVRRNELLKIDRDLTDKEDKELDSIYRKLDKIPSRDRVVDKKRHAGIWAIKLVVSTDAYDEEKDEYVDDYKLGYLKPDGTVARTFNDDCMLNYQQAQDLMDKYAKYPGGPAKPKFEKALMQKFKITDKLASIYLTPGTIKRGRFYAFNMESNLENAYAKEL